MGMRDEDEGKDVARTNEPTQMGSMATEET